MARRISWMGLSVAVASLYAFASPARADFIEKFDVTVPLQNTDFSTTVTLPTFQPQGNEKLLGVALELDAKLSSAVTMTFTSLSTITLTPDALVTVSGPAGVTLSADPTATSQQTLSAQTFSATLINTASNSLAESTSPALLSAFTGGTGSVGLTFSAKGGLRFDNQGGNGGYDVLTKAGGTVTVFYRVAPEPSSVVLLGLGGMGAGVLRRFRRRPAT